MSELNYRVNLLPPRLQREGNLDLRRLLLVAGGAVLFTFFLAAYGIFILNSLRCQNELSVVNQQLVTLQPAVARAELARKKRISLEQILQDYHSCLRERKRWSNLLSDLHRVMPVDLWLTDLEIVRRQGEGSGENAKTAETADLAELPRPDVVLFQGYSRTVASVGVFVSELTRLSCFQQVQLDSLQEDATGYTFKITACLKGGS